MRALSTESNAMKTYEFDVILKGVCEATDEHADALCDAGCDDGTLVSRDGVAWVHFDRNASSLEEAIRTAMAQIKSADLAVLKVELDLAAAQSV
jgi:hypothetical protein